jgi:ferredoxin
MAFVVQEQCVKCKYGDCVEVCPVECFYEGPDMLYINPDECIDCDACAPACPVLAIVSGDDADPKWTEINAKFEYTEDKRRSAKDQVTHGPNWDANLA